jgi:hypothetical protein
MTMQRRSYGAARNKLDLTDRVQVRIVRKRLKVSEEQLAGLVRKAGTSLAAVRKEAGSQRLLTLPRAAVPPAAVIAQQEVAIAEEQAAQL